MEHKYLSSWRTAIANDKRYDRTIKREATPTMPFPFPGMNPYLENPEIWAEVHHWLITGIAESLVERLRPKYRVAVEKRIYRTTDDRSLLVGIPDVMVANSQSAAVTGNVAVALVQDKNLQIVSGRGFHGNYHIQNMNPHEPGYSNRQYLTAASWLARGTSDISSFVFDCPVSGQDSESDGTGQCVYGQS